MADSQTKIRKFFKRPLHELDSIITFTADQTRKEMTMRLAHPFRAKAPSPALLRYLRSQFDCHSSFKPNPRVGLDFVDHTPRDIAWGISALRRPLPSSSKSPSVRRMSTFTAGRAGVDASAIQSSKLVQAKALRPRWITNNLQRLPTKTPCTVRYNSNHQDSDSDSWYRAILPKRSSKQPPEPPEASPPYDGAAEGNMFNLGRSMSGKASNELKLRCTEFDENGNVTLVNGEFKKSELIAKVGTLPP
jgi:magnesium transporter